MEQSTDAAVDRIQLIRERDEPTTISETVGSPSFVGFDLSPVPDTTLNGEQSAQSNNPDNLPASVPADQEATDVNTTSSPTRRNADTSKEAAHSPEASERVQQTAVTESMDRNQQRDRSSNSLGSFDRFLREYSLEVARSDSDSDSEPSTDGQSNGSRSRSPSNPTIPNPFYKIDREHEESQRQRSSQEAKAPVMKTSAEPSNNNEQTTSTSQQPSSHNKVKLEVAASQSAIPRSTPPIATQESVIVDLTGSNPSLPRRDDESDPEFYDDSPRLPKGPGWVQKKRPARRSTRLSSGLSTGGSQNSQKARIGSISPPPSKLRSR